MMGSGYTIRAALVEELPRLAQIERSAGRLFLDTPYSFLVDDRTLSIEFIQQRFNVGQVWVVADRQDRAIGFAVTREVDETLYLQEIDIEPEHGRQGLGSALVEAVCAWAKQSGYRFVSLSTFRDIPWNAPFYAKLGFRILDNLELTDGFRQIRLQEQEAGLPIDDRVIMLCDLQSVKRDD